MPQEKPKPIEAESGVDDECQAPDTNSEEAGEDRPKTAEIGGRKGPEPTRYGDWEKNGIISDF